MSNKWFLLLHFVVILMNFDCVLTILFVCSRQNLVKITVHFAGNCFNAELYLRFGLGLHAMAFWVSTMYPVLLASV